MGRQREKRQKGREKERQIDWEAVTDTDGLGQMETD